MLSAKPHGVLILVVKSHSSFSIAHVWSYFFLLDTSCLFWMECMSFDKETVSIKIKHVQHLPYVLLLHMPYLMPGMLNRKHQDIKINHVQHLPYMLLLHMPYLISGMLNRKRPGIKVKHVQHLPYVLPMHMPYLISGMLNRKHPGMCNIGHTCYQCTCHTWFRECWTESAQVCATSAIRATNAHAILDSGNAEQKAPRYVQHLPHVQHLPYVLLWYLDVFCSAEWY